MSKLTYELLVIESTNGVDRVLIVKSSAVDKDICIDEATRFADFRGEVYIADTIELTEAQANVLDTLRPYMG